MQTPKEEKRPPKIDYLAKMRAQREQQLQNEALDPYGKQQQDIEKVIYNPKLTDK